MASRPKVPRLSQTEEAFLRSFSRVLLTVPRALDADLHVEQRMAMSEYSALMHLSEAPGRRLRMSELAEAVALSLSGMTRVVTRLEAQGFVRRERSAEDGRGWHAVLTDAGLERLRKAWPTHLVSTRRRLFEHLVGVDLAALTAAFEEMSDSAESAVAPRRQVPDAGGVSLDSAVGVMTSAAAGARRN